MPTARIVGHRQVTDAFPVFLARKHGGSVATMDKALAAIHAGSILLVAGRRALISRGGPFRVVFDQRLDGRLATLQLEPKFLQAGVECGGQRVLHMYYSSLKLG